MNVRAGLVVVSIVGVAGCASMGPGGDGGGKPLAPCDAQGVCKIDVSVTRCTIAPPVPDPITITQKDVHIQWELDFASWMAGNRFVDTDAITVRDGRGEFDMPEVSSAGRKLKLHDKNSIPGKYKYTIRVTSNVFGVCTPLDPLIINQG
jgi:hypothetical protein